MPAPAFNVYEPFNGITIAAMNEAFVKMFTNFIDEVDDADDDIALVAYMLDGAKMQTRGKSCGAVCGLKPSHKSQTSVSIVALNVSVSKKIQELIDSFDDVEQELIAFRRALANPRRCREIRDNKLRQMRQAT